MENSKCISFFMPAGEINDLQSIIFELEKNSLVDKIFLMGNLPDSEKRISEKASFANVPSFRTTEGIQAIANLSGTHYTAIYTKTLPLKLGAYALERMVQVAENTGAGMVYADHFQMKGDELCPMPVIDYQDGSLRDDFNFGSLLLFRTDELKKAAGRMNVYYDHAGLYDLRLKVSQNNRLFRIPEFLYTEMETDTRKSGEKMFDYVDPKNRDVQIEMEKA